MMISRSSSLKVQSEEEERKRESWGEFWDSHYKVFVDIVC